MIVYIWPIRSWIPAQGQKHSPTRPQRLRRRNPQRPVYRRQLVDIYHNLTLGLVQRARHGTAEEADQARAVLGRVVTITKMRGRFYDWHGIPVMLTFHPSYLLRDPTKKKEVWDDMKMLLARMGRPIPGKG